MTDIKSVIGVYKPGSTHMVGDGFPVRNAGLINVQPVKFPVSLSGAPLTELLFPVEEMEWASKLKLNPLCRV